ncbi:MAG: antibiotic biosynthesis monooxygenase [Chloroflexi bacterium]|nr:antibiotic biosynthesis monooxygenase [Chloroflexota bacterium]
MFAIIWNYIADPEKQAEFEAAYGPDGDWADLFRKGRGYIRTELLRDIDKQNRYTTIDHWKTAEDYKIFHNQFAVEYQALDARFEAWIINETLIGTFEILAG